MFPPPADVGYQFGPTHTGLMLSHPLAEHIKMSKYVPPVHPFRAQFPCGPPSEQLLDRLITVDMA